MIKAFVLVVVSIHQALNINTAVMVTLLRKTIV